MMWKYVAWNIMMMMMVMIIIIIVVTMMMMIVDVEVCCFEEWPGVGG